jgi:serine/threonine protein kinase
MPGEEQALAWMAQVADTLAALHAQGIVNCNIELANLVIQPGDRVVLIDLTGCQSIHEVGVETHSNASVRGEVLGLGAGDDSLTPTEAKSEDLRNLAVELERWYLAVREAEPPVEPGQIVGARSPLHSGSPLPGC